jgi:hypothetical protein
VEQVLKRRDGARFEVRQPFESEPTEHSARLAVLARHKSTALSERPVVALARLDERDQHEIREGWAVRNGALVGQIHVDADP